MGVRSLLLAACALLVVACSSEGNVFSLEVGQCFDQPDGDTVQNVEIVDCDDSFDAEVFALFDLPGGDFPGAEEAASSAFDGCLSRFEPYVGIDYFESEIFLDALFPTAESWEQDDREVVCFLFEPNVRLQGSQQGAAR